MLTLEWNSNWIDDSRRIFSCYTYDYSGFFFFLTMLLLNPLFNWKMMIEIKDIYEKKIS